LPTSPRLAIAGTPRPKNASAGEVPLFRVAIGCRRRAVAIVCCRGREKRYQKTLSTEEVFISAENKGCQPDLGGGFRFKHETKNQPVHAEFDPTGYVSGVP
jgi:hypothetical protein